MEPKIVREEDFLVAGVSGGGDETGKAWEAFERLNKLSPLLNRVSEVGYEVRVYPGGAGPGRVHVGVRVKDANVPPEYKLFSVPASLYAEFVIYPSKGYGSSNAEMNAWLSDNAGVYRQGLLGDRGYAIEVYDKRYKGDHDPESVVGILVPIVPVKRP